ncbi:glycosyltransferase [Lutispora sp.]|uniref:glycosyltransferase n=1 Tax=Lutispora sp. TaxID=2828727 RepID=UPI003563FFFD
MGSCTISLCMIVKDEEKFLNQCLESVSGKVDEIIIVDTGSTDKTVEIAEKHGAVIKYFEWINDFAAARNYSIADAKSDYILILDADEYLDECADLQKELAHNKDFYRLVIKNYQNEGRVVFHQNVRLFKSRIGLKYSGKLHEHLNTFDEACGYSGLESDIVIHHVGYLPEVVSERGKKKRNHDIMMKELAENPTGYSYFNMGLVYMTDEQYDKALEMFRKSYPLSKEKTYVKSLLVRMSECLNYLGRTEEGIKLLLDFINVYPAYIDACYTLGTLFLSRRYLKDAEIMFRSCLESGDRMDNITAEGVGSYMAHYQLAVVYDRMGRSGDAFDEVFKAITKKKSFTPALSLYLKLMQRAGIGPEEIKEHLNKIYKPNTAEEIKALIYSLYEIRHPLMSNFNFILQDLRLTDMKAVALMLDKQYEASLKEWEKVDTISNNNVLDVAVLCLLTKSIDIANKLRDCLNLSKKEWKFISRILLKEAVDKPCITPAVEKTLYNICEYLINISEFDYFEYVSEYILLCSAETLNKLAYLLIEYNFIDTAIELLSICIEQNPTHTGSYILFGDAYRKQNRTSNALECYEAVLNLKEEYHIYEKIYDTYAALGDLANADKTRNTMKMKFPLSLWLKNI